MYKKSQAALEFLTTYGWAFIVIGIVIAAIAYFGILNPQKLLPDRCNFNVGFDCQAYEIGSAGTFELRLKNGLGKVVTVPANGITLRTESAIPFTCTTTPTFPISNWNVAELKDLAWSGCNAAAIGFVSGDKGKVFVNITYFEVKAGSAYTHIADGEVFSTIT